MAYTPLYRPRDLIHSIYSLPYISTHLLTRLYTRAKYVFYTNLSELIYTSYDRLTRIEKYTRTDNSYSNN